MISQNKIQIVTLPAPLSPNGKFTLAPLVRRNQRSSAQARLFLGRNFSFNGNPPDSFFELAAIRRFAFHGQLTADLAIGAPAISFANPLPASLGNDPLPLVGGVNIQLDGPDLILPECFDFDALSNALLLFVGDEIFSIASAAMTGAGAFTLQAIRGRFGTGILNHQNGDEIFILPAADLTVLQHPFFATGNTALFKLTMGVQQPGDVGSFEVPL
jgi:hypothetical protein